MKVGIDIGGSHVSVGVVNGNGKILEQFEKDYTVQEKQNIMQVAENFIIEEIKKIREKYEIDKVGVAIPGTISRDTIVRSVNLGVENYAIKDILLSKLGNNIEISVLNDAKSAAIAEFNFRKNIESKHNEDLNNMLFLTLGTGIGGAYIYNGKLLSGTKFDGYEFGHMILKEGGIRCNCGKKGCFEKYGSILSFKSKCIERLGLQHNISGPELRKIIGQNLDRLQDIIQEYIYDLAIGLSNLINIFEPDVTVIGGGFARYDYLLLDLLKKRIVEENLLFNKRENIKIEVAKLGNDAGIVGAVL